MVEHHNVYVYLCQEKPLKINHQKDTQVSYESFEREITDKK